MRARLHHLAERVPGGVRPDPRRHRPPVRERRARATSTRSTATRTGSSRPRTPRPTRWSGSGSRARGARRSSSTSRSTTASYDALVFFTYLYAPTVLGLKVAPVEEHPDPDRARRAGHPPVDLPDGLRAAGGHRLQHRGRAPVPRPRTSRSTRGGGDGRLRRGPAAAPRLPAAGARRRRRDRGGRRGGRPRAASAAGSARTSRRAARCSGGGTACTGRSSLYGGRIEKGKGCEELIEYFSTYVGEGGEASLVLMGVKLMPLPEEPFIKFAGLLSDIERGQALEAATVVVGPVAVREPVAARARGVLGGHAGARQRPQRGARGPLPERATPGCSTPTATSSWSAWTRWCATNACAPASAATAATTCGRTTGGTSSCRSTSRMFGTTQGAVRQD